VRESILEGDLGRFRAVVESLSDEFDLVDIALGAVKMAHEASVSGAEGDEEEIPEEKPFREKTRGEPAPKKSRRGAARKGGFTRIFIGAGRAARIRPGDLVGAITGESGISGDQIGSIQISERFSIVEIADDVAGRVVQSMRAAKVKGKKVKVDMDRGR